MAQHWYVDWPITRAVIAASWIIPDVSSLSHVIYCRASEWTVQQFECCTEYSTTTVLYYTVVYTVLYTVYLYVCMYSTVSSPSWPRKGYTHCIHCTLYIQGLLYCIACTVQYIQSVYSIQYCTVQYRERHWSLRGKLFLLVDVLYCMRSVTSQLQSTAQWWMDGWLAVY